MDLLVVAAWEPELQRFRELTGGSVAAHAVGVGLVEAGIGTTRRVMEAQPAHVVLLGTCGALSGDLAIGDVVVAESVLLDGAHLPAPMPREVAWAEALVLSTRRVRVVTTLGVTVDDARAAELAVLAHVEHLEAFAFARACTVAGVAFSIVLGVANPVGSRGREAWREHHEMASARAAEVLYEALALRTSTTTPTTAQA